MDMCSNNLKKHTGYIVVDCVFTLDNIGGGPNLKRCVEDVVQTFLSMCLYDVFSLVLIEPRTHQT